MPVKTFVLRGRGEPETLMIEGRRGSWRVRRRGEETDAETVRLPDGRLSVLLSDGRQFCGRVAPRGKGEVEISTSRGVCRIALADRLHDRVDHASQLGGSGESEEEVRALMPGRVVEVPVKAGDRVEAGSLLLVLEAMKMQNEIRCERAGVVGRVEVASGEAVERGAMLLTIR
jgi:biotin carboxyl carrier protein